MTVSRTRGTLVGLAGLAALLVVGAVVLFDGRDSATFYISPTGSDDNAGTSEAAPWRSLPRVGTADLRPGDRILLRGGARFAATELTVPRSAAGTRANPIVVGSYGTGRGSITGSSGSCITIAGSWVTVRDVVTQDCTYSGLSITGDHVTVTDIETSGSFAGVTIRDGADHAVVRDSYIHDNVTMRPDTPGPDDDSGAFGVLVNGDHALVTGNTISGQDAPSADYGTDGAAVELYGAKGTVVSYNIARDNHTFTELGGIPGVDESRDSTYAYNQVTSRQLDSKFVVLHAGGRWGRASATRLIHNTAILSGPGSEGFVCGPECGTDALIMEANLISASYQSGSVSGTYTQSHNILAGAAPKCVVAHVTEPCPDTFVTDPRVDGSGDYVTLRTGSPAIDSGGSDSGYSVDIAGQQVPVDGSGVGHGRADAGAWEHPAP